MGMTIWVSYLTDGKVSSDEADRSGIYRHLDRLDSVCADLGVRPLSDFLDTTDLEAGFDESLPPDTNTWELMGTTGKWFDPEEGLRSLAPLIRRLEEQPVRFGLLTDGYDAVMEDLRACREAVQTARTNGSRFQLTVVS